MSYTVSVGPLGLSTGSIFVCRENSLFVEFAAPIDPLLVVYLKKESMPFDHKFCFYAQLCAAVFPGNYLNI